MTADPREGGAQAPGQDGRAPPPASLEAAIRQIWFARALSAVLVAGSAALAAVVSPPAVALVALALVAEAAVAVLQARVVRALRAGDDGEILLQLGARVPLRLYRELATGERLEAVVHAGVAVCGVLLVAGTRWGILVQGVLAVALALGLALTRARRQSNAVLESTVALTRLDAAAVERWLRQVEDTQVPAWLKAARGHRSTLRLWRGDAAGALSDMEADWSGTLDAEATSVALLRLGLRGDGDLARRWLAASKPTTRYERWLHASVAGPLALSESRWEDALAAATDPGARDVPPFFLRQLDLVSAAALRASGRVEEGDRILAALDPPLDRESWRAVASPQLWALLGRAPAAPRTGAPSRGPTLADSPFAPPEQASRRARPKASTWRGTGAIPAEHVVLTAARRNVVLQGLASASLVAMAPTLVVASPVLALVDPAFWSLALTCMALGIFGLATGVLRAVDLLIARPPVPGRAVVALGDGRTVPGGLWTWFSLRSVSDLLSVLVLLVAALGLSEGLAVGSWTVLAVAVPMAALYAWAGLRRHGLMRVVGAGHFRPPSEARALAERELADKRVGRNPARIWLGLARLFDGDLPGAEGVARQESDLDPNAGFLLRWIRAARGEADLDALLAAPDPEATGDRYRAAVTLGLAALHAGRADRVAARLDDWAALAKEVPNRYGALLQLLVDAARGESPPVDPDLARIVAVWPFVAGKKEAS